MVIFAPTPTTSPLPTFNPTPTPIPITDKPTKSNAPSKTPTRAPTLSPVQDERPKVIRDEITNVITAVTCEESFHVDTLLNAYNFTNPPLTDVMIEFDYEAFVNDGFDKTAALEEIDYKIFISVLNASPWMNNNIPTSSCDDMLINVLNIDVLGETTRNRKLQLSEDWDYFLGWKNDPVDAYIDGTDCVSDPIENLDGYTCYPIHGRITAQVPIDLELSPMAIQLQVMNHVKASVENNPFESENIGAVSFIGQTILEDRNEVDRDKVPTSPPDSLNNDNNLLSAFGITVICAIAVTVVFVTGLFGRRYHKRRKERQFEALQNEAISLGGGVPRSDDYPQTPEKVEQPRHVFTESSPDGVEIVDMNTCDARAGGDDDASAQDRGKSGGRRGFTIGSLMDGFRGGKDDLSYASGLSKGGMEEHSIADDSALSVETEDYTNSIGPSSFPKMTSVSNGRKFAS
jgi:Predicted solute binding protein